METNKEPSIFIQIVGFLVVASILFGMIGYRFYFLRKAALRVDEVPLESMSK